MKSSEKEFGMERSKKSKDGSLVFVIRRNSNCVIHFMTVYQEGLIIDAEFTKPSFYEEKEWDIGPKGAVKMIISQGGAWQEIMIDYCLQKGYIHLTAVTALYLTKPILSSIASQFFIRKGTMLQFLSAESIYEMKTLKKERFVTIRIPTN